MRAWLVKCEQALWSLDAVPLVVLYTIIILVMPMPRTNVPTSGR